jgi:hypothetical protein
LVALVLPLARQKAQNQGLFFGERMRCAARVKNLSQKKNQRLQTYARFASKQPLVQGLLLEAGLLEKPRANVGFSNL